MRGGRSWAEAGNDVIPDPPPAPPRSILLEMAVGYLSSRKQPIPVSADELAEVGSRIHLDQWRQEVISKLIREKKINRITREHDFVYVYSVNNTPVCTVGCEEPITDELLAQLGLAIRFMPEPFNYDSSFP